MRSTKQDDFRVLEPEEIQFTKRDIQGEEYLKIFRDVEKIIFHQKSHHIAEGIKGFVFHGDVGVGKTSLAKAMAHDLGSTLIFIDGSDIARPLYGEAENQIARVFKEAETFRHAMVLIDDCESVFPKRDWLKGESWHVAQNNVFFHVLDAINSAKTVVILTTNRYDLLDKAVIDRLENIEFPRPSKKALHEIAQIKVKKLRMDSVDGLEEAIDSGEFQSVRSLEKFITRRYIDSITVQ